MLISFSKFPELLARELGSIVCDEFIWDPITCKLAFESGDAGAVIHVVNFYESRVVVNRTIHSGHCLVFPMGG